jgi:hypothetical protein
VKVFPHLFFLFPRVSLPAPFSRSAFPAAFEAHPFAFQVPLFQPVFAYFVLF